MDKRDMTKSLRWDSYVLIKGDQKIETFWNSHLQTPQKRLLFILGKGFDVRMNMGLLCLLKNNQQFELTCLLIEFDEGYSSSSNDYQDYVEENLKQLQSLKNISIENKKIKLWKGKGRNRRRIADREAANLISNYEDIKSYSDIIIDVSALPRGIYFSLIGKVLSLIDTNKTDGVEEHNLFILTTESAKIDEITVEDFIDIDLKFTHGFGGGLELTSNRPTIWFPILGENKKIQIEKAHNKINPDEICPLLPFPSKDPRRSDALIIEYHQLLFDDLRIEPQNLLYVPEQNPFEVYRSLSNAIINYNETLSILNGCKAAISTFSSKLLSIGALITAYEFNRPLRENDIGVGILNVDSNGGYKIEAKPKLDVLKTECDMFLAWLAGEPYNP